MTDLRCAHNKNLNCVIASSAATQKAQTYGFLQGWSQVSKKLTKPTIPKIEQYLQHFSFYMSFVPFL
jgi:hypothetical protein